jgi:hypothetical protein
MRIFSILAALTLVAGCGGGGGNDHQDGGGSDGIVHMDAAGHDLTPPAPKAIGAPCRKDVDCGSGELCLLTEANSNLSFPKGYCTQSCASNGTCNDGTSTCVGFSATAAYCFTSCLGANADTTPCPEGSNYACALLFDQTGTVLPDGACLPTTESQGGVACDPAAGDGTCTNPSDTTDHNRYVCRRSRWGTGNAGGCLNAVACELGTNVCPPTSSTANPANAPQHCFVEPAILPHLDAFPQDKFADGICVSLLTGPPATGAECLFDDGTGTKRDFPDACVDGDECNVTAFTQTGDNKCRAFCYPDGAPSSSIIPDGGVVAADCAGTCEKVFGNFNLGLCIPSTSGTPDAGADAGN